MCNDRPIDAENELKAVAKLPTRSAHQVIAELAQEHHELCSKIDRLEAFLKAGAPGVAPKHVQYLREQFGHMTGYALSLNLRMKDLLDSMRESSDSE